MSPYITSDKRQNGFTLIEFSIVLVVIALLAGGIFMAQSMIRQAQIRGVAGEFDATKKAISEFRDKYMGLPGDITTAESIWGSDSGCPGSSSVTAVKSVTCNGDGSGTIGSSTNSGALSRQWEWFRAWQQLSNAGLIRGSFTGAAGINGVSEAVIGVNVPTSELSGAGWTLNYMLLNSSGMMWGDQYGHLLNLGGAVANDYTRGPILGGDEALSLDTKIDDGSPGRGMVRSWRTSMLPNCTTNDDSQDTAVYNATYVEPACALVFVLGF